MKTEKILVLDLDGTIIYTDTFHEMLWIALKCKPWVFFQAFYWLLFKNRAKAKFLLVERISLDLEKLPYNETLIKEAQRLRQKGLRITLATGTHQCLAEQIAHHLGFIDEVIGSHGNINMTGANKAKALEGRNIFAYAGDSKIDRHIWELSQEVWVVNPKRGTLGVAQKLAQRQDKEVRLFS